MSGVDITPGDTLIVLDEVQDIPEAIESLKYFCEDAPEYHIAIAGSLLGISLHKDVSYPVGKVDEINVFPLNFAEFLLAKGEVKAEGNVRANALSNLLKQTPELHAFRYSMKPYIEQEQMTCYPLYAVQ